jgi:hypothetical protein
MAQSPLLSAKPTSLSVCGKILHGGQSIIVAEAAVGPKERLMESRGRISIRSSNEKGKLQITCKL